MCVYIFQSLCKGTEVAVYKMIVNVVMKYKRHPLNNQAWVVTVMDIPHIHT